MLFIGAASLAVNTRFVESYEKEFFNHMIKCNLKFFSGAEPINSNLAPPVNPAKTKTAQQNQQSSQVGVEPSETRN